MSLALYMDVHVPAAITRALRRRGVDVLTAQEDGNARLPDPALLTGLLSWAASSSRATRTFSRKASVASERDIRSQRSFMPISNTYPSVGV